MHILLIHQAFASPGDPGGTRHYEFARHIVQRGHDFTIVASNINYATGQQLTDCKGLMTEQHLDDMQILRAHTYPAMHRSIFWRVVSLASFSFSSFFAALRTGPVDLVMGTSPPIFQALSAWLVAALRRCPFLLEVRDLWPEFPIGMGLLKNPLLIFLSRRLESFLYSRATHILVNSPAYRDYLLRRGIRESKISLIPNGVDPDMFDPACTGGAIRERLHLRQKFIVTYAGALGPSNDIWTILRAAEHLRDKEKIHFLLVGDGIEHRNLQDYAHSQELSNVTFTGACPKSDIPDVLAASDACIATLKDIPAFRTTYPNKVFDYMAAGRPTILAVDGVIRDVLEAADGGFFVPPGDDTAMAEAVLLLFQDRTRARAMGEAARAYVIQNFNRHEHAVNFEELAQSLVGRGAA